jgi:uncharacterized protein YbbK (DUF523 family)
MTEREKKQREKDEKELTEIASKLELGFSTPRFRKLISKIARENTERKNRESKEAKP